MLIKHSISRPFSLAIVLIFFILSFVPHLVKNTSMNLGFIKSNSETVSESIENSLKKLLKQPKALTC